MMMDEGPEDDVNSIGNRLMEYGLAPAQLEKALKHQSKHGGMLLGEICIELGFIERPTLEVAVALQAAHSNGGVKTLAKMATARTRVLGHRVEENILMGNRVLASLNG